MLSPTHTKDIEGARNRKVCFNIYTFLYLLGIKIEVKLHSAVSYQNVMCK